MKPLPRDVVVNKNTYERKARVRVTNSQQKITAFSKHLLINLEYCVLRGQ